MCGAVGYGCRALGDGYKSGGVDGRSCDGRWSVSWSYWAHSGRYGNCRCDDGFVVQGTVGHGCGTLSDRGDRRSVDCGGRVGLGRCGRSTNCDDAT